MGSFAADLSLVLPDSPRPWRQRLQPQKLQFLPQGMVGEMKPTTFTEEDEEENADDAIDNNANDDNHDNENVEEEPFPAKGIWKN